MENSVNKNIILTRNVFLKFLSGIYLFAFLSIYFQIQGLWGDEGISPARNLLELLKENFKEKANYWNFPTLLFFHEKINKFFINFISGNIINNTMDNSIDNSLYILCIIGIIISLSILLNFYFAYNPIGFLIIWLIYLNFFIIGQEFMDLPSDTLLLEVGFISIFLCPIYKGNLSKITPIDEVVFHLIRFILFRFMYSNGINKLSSNCPAWMKFNTLHYYFQSQPFPTFLGYLAHFSLPDGLKRMLSAETLFIHIFLTFLYFSFFRRLNIFAGCLNFCFFISIMLTGNYNFFNLLLINLNLSLFDDEFLIKIIPNFILQFLDLEVKNLIKKKVRFIYERLDENEIIDENNNSSYINTIQNDLNKNNSSTNFITNFLTESIIFVNFLSISLVITFFYFFPLKELLQKTLIYKLSDIKGIYNQIFLNLYMIFIFIYLILILFKGILKIVVKKLNSNLNFSMINVIINFVSTIFSMIKYFIFLSFFILYFINSVNVFYKNINLKLVTENINSDSVFVKFVNYSEFVLTKFRINHNYDFYNRIPGIDSRNELVVKMFNQENERWEELNFIYKISDSEKFSFKFNTPHHPRLDYQLWNTAAMSKDINSSSWLFILLGKVFEGNPIVLDLLGYQIEEKEFYYKCKLLFLFYFYFI